MAKTTPSKKRKKIVAATTTTTTAADNPYLPKKIKVLEFFRESSDNFTITVNFKSNHEPGQFVMVSLPGIGEAPISISSYSTEFVKLDIRQVGSVTNAAAKLRKGDFVFVRGPYGKGYPMDVLEGNNIVMIGGGCGVAPLKGIIEYVGQNRSKFRNIDLFLGYRSVSDILFTRELNGWKKDYNTMISVDKTGEGETCGPDMKVGFITEHLRNSSISNNNCVAFICGPPKMIELVIGILKEKGFHSDQIFVSTERLMQCAIGKCGHCMIHGKYTCLDGPVFRWDELEGYRND